MGERELEPWVGEPKPQGKISLGGNPSPDMTYLPTSSFKGLVIPHSRRRGTAEADAPINVHQSPQGQQPVLWAEAPHQGLARSQFWAFYHALKLP